MKVIRIGICVLFAFAVISHGAVEAWSEAILGGGAALLFLVWALLAASGREAELRWTALGWPLLALLAFGAFQYVARLTVYPYLTKLELMRLLSYFLLFFLTVQAVRTERHWYSFAWFLLVLAFAVSLFGFLQHFTFNGKLYWVRELRFGGVPFGPYVNRNHFAGLAELLVPVGLSILVFRAVRRDLLPLVALFTVLPIGAVFFSASRAGIVSLLVEVGLLVILLWLGRGAKAHLVAGAIVLLLAAITVAWLGIGPALERFSGFEKLEVTEERRMAMAHDTWHIFLDHPLAGTGLGTLRAVYPRYDSAYDGKLVDHAHNDYLELLADAGIPGGLCAIAFLILLCRLGWMRLVESRGPLEPALRAGALVACGGLLAHGFVDFNFHIPSNALLFFLQAALAVMPLERAPVTD